MSIKLIVQGREIPPEQSDKLTESKVDCFYSNGPFLN